MITISLANLILKVIVTFLAGAFCVWRLQKKDYFFGIGIIVAQVLDFITLLHYLKAL